MKTEHLSQFNWTHKQTPEGWTICYDPEGTKRCGTKKSNGEPCLQTRVRETGRCAVHQRGASAKKGFEHPSTKDGKQSQYLKHLPSRKMEQFREIMESLDLLSLDENVGIMDLFIQDLLPRLYSGDPGQLWLDIKDSYDEMQANLRLALSGNNPMAMSQFMREFQTLGDLIKSGRRDWITRQEIMKISNHKRELVKTVSDVQYKGENAITVTQFMELLEFMERLFFRVNEIENKDERKQAYADGLRQMSESEIIQ